MGSLFLCLVLVKGQPRECQILRMSYCLRIAFPMINTNNGFATGFLKHGPIWSSIRSPARPILQRSVCHPSTCFLNQKHSFCPRLFYAMRASPVVNVTEPFFTPHAPATARSASRGGFV